MAKYAALIYNPTGLDPHGSPEIMAAYGGFIGNAGQAGVLAGGEPLAGVDLATTITVANGEGGGVLTSDGPAVETGTDELAGFFMLDCNNLDDAITWAARIPSAWLGGKIELRPIVEDD